MVGKLLPTIYYSTVNKRIFKEGFLGAPLKNSYSIPNNSTSNISENYTKRVKGNSGVSATAQKMIAQYRDNIRAIDREIIEKLDILFMGLY